jgi:hypothetical protein
MGLLNVKYCDIKYVMYILYHNIMHYYPFSMTIVSNQKCIFY